jgi:hypothetical protein
MLLIRSATSLTIVGPTDVVGIVAGAGFTVAP